MGICSATPKTKRNSNDGEISKVIEKLKIAEDPQLIMTQKCNDNTPYNPFKNPILNRRLKDSTPTKVGNNGQQTID